jgi:hypothetical protein
MKNAMQLKALINNVAKKKNLSAQAVMQNYMFERLLERISLSKYQSKFIISGKYINTRSEGLRDG